MTITIPTIAALPTAPTRTDPSTFATRGDAFVAALATLRSEMNTATAAIKSQVEAEVNALAPLASPTFTGSPAAPTASPGDNDTSIATTAFVTAAITAAGGAGISSGNWVMLKDTTISGTPSAVDFVHGTGGVVLSATYDEYLVTFSAVKPTTDNVALYMRTSTDASTFAASSGDYKFHTSTSAGGGAVTETGDGGTSTFFQLATSVGTASGEEGVFGYVHFFKPSAASPLLAQWFTFYKESSVNSYVQRTVGQGERIAAADVDGIRFLLSADTFASGRIKLFARKL